MVEHLTDLAWRGLPKDHSETSWSPEDKKWIGDKLINHKESDPWTILNVYTQFNIKIKKR